MNKFLEKLLNGREVEWRKIWEVTIWDKKFNAVEKYKQPKIIKYHYLLAKEIKELIVENGDVKLLTTNTSDLWTSESLVKDIMSEGEIVAIPWGGNVNIQYYKGKFVTSDNRIATSVDTSILNNKFLYYYFLTNIELIKSFYRGSGIKHPNMAAILDMDIPIPPLDVQEEIVRILDKFTELNKELNKELNARKKQYKYYLNKLLTFGDEVEWKSLGGGGVTLRGKGVNITAKQMREINKKNAPIKIFAGGKTVAFVHYEDIDEKSINYNPSIIVKSRGIIEFEYYDKPFSHKNEMWSYYSNNENIDIKFVYYFLKTKEDYFQRLGSKMQMPQISISDTDNFKIPIPPIEKQKEIVAILDKFNTLTNSITEGLPKEINLRQKQYEYYRDLLLDFKK